jgi:hypothetical protein
MRNTFFIMFVICYANNAAYAQSQKRWARDYSVDSLKDGMRITITGTAKDAKMAAAILTDSNEVVYIDKLHSWSKENINKKMKVTGTVWIMDCPPEGLYNKYGQINQYAIGRHVFLKNAVWKEIR